MGTGAVGTYIRSYRQKRGYSQDQLAELASLNRVTITKYEAGRVEPGASSLDKIADALDVSVDALLGRSTDKQDEDPDDEVSALREQLRRSPDTRILFDAARKASPEHIRAATAVLKALEPEAVP